MAKYRQWELIEVWQYYDFEATDEEIENLIKSNEDASYLNKDANASIKIDTDTVVKEVIIETIEDTPKQILEKYY